MKKQSLSDKEVDYTIDRELYPLSNYYYSKNVKEAVKKLKEDIDTTTIIGNKFAQKEWILNRINEIFGDKLVEKGK